ncbi:hypothetical protein DSM106972_031030 [Dulcicalothrix desertica PCC 7102]|uniref:Uncharacterized protein n=1 Tax=Dulcicalothrix desertica PCC 7102 TaxID=232991 RepID=A0A433VII7_9CYAN|nr:hypothetical protein [Dulcicalothrix desertica]RUT05897.1 hypothetical protein DSM106972_031030 [Dulcicalothrix desertica PCC 7102]TWH54406.1 hypothetical protein CAL7102_02437 [Dulcicalothrix desertica PCC 7102]
MVYDVPGRADILSLELVQKWNEAIQAAYNNLQADLGSRFFSLDPKSLSESVLAAIQWFGDPAEPAFCLGSDVGQKLSDWGSRGRHVLHNEYCEYRVIERADATGRMRPKRVQITTELREYWVCIAKHDPQTLRSMAQSILGFEPGWEDLYGVSDPESLSEDEREIAFSTLVAGHGNDNKMVEANVPRQPTGKINTENALFMTHPINGLDDLLYIVMFGAKPYANRTDNGLEKATREQLFRQFSVEQLACRHADPAAAMGALGAAFNGQTVAFANPLGMYIRSFTKDVFLFEGDTIPSEWVRWSRGSEEGMFQHLEFGPSDSDEAFLDDITLVVGSREEPVIGGFQVVQQIEVGPLVIAGKPTPVADDEYVVLTASSESIDCQQAEVCEIIRNLKEEFDNALQMVRVAPRTMGFRRES